MRIEDREMETLGHAQSLLTTISMEKGKNISYCVYKEWRKKDQKEKKNQQ